MTNLLESTKRIHFEMEMQGIDPDMKLFAEFAPAFIGFATRGSSSEPLAAYDYDKCSGVLQDRDGMTEEEALEFLEYNYVNSWLGDGTPFFVKVAS